MIPEQFYLFSIKNGGWITPAFGTTTRPPGEFAKKFLLSEAVAYCAKRFSEGHSVIPVSTFLIESIESAVDGN